MTVELVPVSVPGSSLPLPTDGIENAVLRPVVEYFGLDYSTQLRKLKTKSWATMVNLTTVGADGKPREMVGVDRRTLGMWLATLDEKRVAEERREDLRAYQAEAADALDAYFHEGGVINHRATEDQVERLSREIQSQAAVLKSFKGLIDPVHLEAKARILMARALGEAPEFDESLRPLYVESYLRAKGLKPDLVKAKRVGFGNKLRVEFIKKYDRAPGKHWGEVDGRPREINAYTEADRPLFDKVWARHYEGVVADAAFTVIEGGAS